jgi:hypothetical protein
VCLLYAAHSPLRQAPGARFKSRRRAARHLLRKSERGKAKEEKQISIIFISTTIVS